MSPPPSDGSTASSASTRWLDPSEIVVVADGLPTIPTGWPPICCPRPSTTRAAQSILIADDAGRSPRVWSRRRSRRQLGRPGDRRGCVRRSWARPRRGGDRTLESSAPRLVDLIAPEHVEFAIDAIRKAAGRSGPARWRHLPRTLYARGDRRLCRRLQPRACRPAARRGFPPDLSIYDFIKRTSIVKCDRGRPSPSLAPATDRPGAKRKGLPAHARSASPSA